MKLQTKILPKVQRGAGLIIYYDIFDYQGHALLVGQTENGSVCFAGFTNVAETILTYYPKAVLHKATKGSIDVEKYNFYAEGTDLQVKVWHELLNIRKGQTITYKELAKRVGKPQAVRAIGNAVGANPISVYVPCHRVLHTQGNKIGYAWGPDVKESLLKAEGVF